MSIHNVWEEHLIDLAKTHEKYDLVSEAEHLRKAVELRVVVNEQTFRAVLAAIRWWSDTMIDEAVRKIRADADLNPSVEIVLRMGAIEVARNAKVVWDRNAALDLEALMHLDAATEIGAIVAKAVYMLFNPRQEIVIGDVPPFLLEMGKELVTEILSVHPLTEKEKVDRYRAIVYDLGTVE